MIKVAAHILSLLPLGYLIIAALLQELGADPQEVLLHELGIISLWFLLASLAVTPARIILGTPSIVRYRRMLGLYFFFYLSCHLLVYCWFFLGWDFSWLSEEVVERPYITVGFLAWLLAVPLTITSNRYMQKALKHRWLILHRMVYLIAVLGLAHFIWQSKADLNRPLFYSLVFAALMIMRIWSKYRRFLRKKASV